MTKEEYLEKLVNDFGALQGFDKDESDEFLIVLKKLLKHKISDDSEPSNEDIINLIIQKDD